MSRGGSYRERAYPPASEDDRYGSNHGSAAAREWDYYNRGPPHSGGQASVDPRERMRYERERESWYHERERERERDRNERDYRQRAPSAYDVRDPRAMAARLRIDPRYGREGDAERYGSHPSAAAAYEDRRHSWNERDGREWAGPASYGDLADGRDATGRSRGGAEQWRANPPLDSPHRSGSPRSSRRSSPSSSAAAAVANRLSPTPLSAPPSNAPPTGPRARRASPASTSWSTIDSSGQSEKPYSATPPTGPRRSLVRPSAVAQVPPTGFTRAPPTGPRGSFESSYTAPPTRTPSRAYDHSPVTAESVPNASSSQQPPTPVSAAAPRDGFAPRRSASYLQLPLQSPASASARNPSLTPGTYSGPSTPTVGQQFDSSGRRIAWSDKEIKGSLFAKGEADAFTFSLERIRGMKAIHAHPSMQALRKALNDLADSDVEVSGARAKTNVTEAALERAKEQSDAWSIETSRIELEQRNLGEQGYWTVQRPTSTPS